MKTLIVFGLLCSALAGQAYGGMMTGEGCPSGRSPGDTWYLPSCMMCHCGGDTHSCYTCGIFRIDIDRSRCYIFRNRRLRYPGCCEPFIKCRGDRGFSESQFVRCQRIEC